MPRPKFLNSKSIVQVFEETLAEFWKAIKDYFWEIIRILKGRIDD